MRKGSSSILGAVLLAIGIGLVGFTIYQWFADPGEVPLPPSAMEPDTGIPTSTLWQPSPQGTAESALPGAALAAETIPAESPLPMPLPVPESNSKQDLAPTSDQATPTAMATTPAISLLEPPAPTTPPTTPPPGTGFVLPSTAQPPDPSTHTVAAGDTLGSIAKKYLGKESYWPQIAQMNPTVDPLRLRIGQVIQLPSSASAEDSSNSATSTVDPPSELIIPANAKTHVVRDGDTFWTIAQEHYDNGALWQSIYRANRQIVGANPDRLSTGMKLIIPPKPTE